MGLTYLDSSVLIDATQVRDRRGAATRDLIENSAASTQLVTSGLVDLECMVRPLRSRNRAAIEAVSSALSRFRHLEISPRAFELAAHIRAAHGLKTPDALHAATASLGGCDKLWTGDEKLLRALPEFAIDPLAGP